MSNLILITLWRSCEFLRFSVQKRKTRQAKRFAFPNVLWHPPPSLGNSCNIAITLTLRRSPVRFRDILSGRPPGRPHRRHGNNQASLGYEADERQREIPNCCMGDCGLLCWGFWALYFFPTAPVPINSAEPIWTLVRLIIPLRFLSSCPLSLWLVLVAKAADRGKPDSQQPTSRNSGPAQPRNQQVEESLSINSHSDSCIGVK
jgi:hypothetical protein